MSGVNANITNPAKTTKAEVDHKNYNKCNDHSYNSVSVSGFVFQPSPPNTHTHSPHPPPPHTHFLCHPSLEDHQGKSLFVLCVYVAFLDQLATTNSCYITREKNGWKQIKFGNPVLDQLRPFSLYQEQKHQEIYGNI